MEIFEQHESSIRGYCRVYPTVFASASNARQVDEHGKSFIDFFAGAGVLNFGHNNPKMKEALIQFIQGDGVAHSLDMYTTAKRDFIAAFAKTVLAPRKMTHRLQFTGPTGTNAVEAAMKLARKVTKRHDVVAFTHGFHGMTLGSLAATANSLFRNAAGVPLHHVSRQPFGCEKRCMGCNLGCGVESVAALRATYEDASSGVAKPAAFLLEPIQAEGGVRVASQAWLQAVQDLARDLGALVIFDDIQAGIGRTGQYFSFDGMGLDPDIVCLAKGVGGFGTPLALNLVKPEHDEHWSPGEHTGTFRGQGLSFVAGRVALSYFEDDSFLAGVRAKGDTMRRALEEIAGRHSDRHAMQVRGKGMMGGLDVADSDVSKKVVAGCFERGLILGACGTGGQVLKLIPPLTIDEGDLDEGLKILGDALDAAMA